jgi:hypothetical protein
MLLDEVRVNVDGERRLISCVSLAICILDEFRYGDNLLTHSCIPFLLAPNNSGAPLVKSVIDEICSNRDDPFTHMYTHFTSTFLLWCLRVSLQCL